MTDSPGVRLAYTDAADAADGTDTAVDVVADVVVIGAGVFGAAASLALAERGRKVALLDPGPIPHPLAASTDISKVVRMEYGADDDYMALMERARRGWLAWNERWADAPGAERSEPGAPDAPLYRETGVLMLTSAPMRSGEFEHESFRALVRRGHAPERMNPDEIARRFPAWKPGAFADGFYHAAGGYADSGRVVAWLVERAQQRGVALYTGEEVVRLLGDGDDSDDGDDARVVRVTGVQTRSGARFSADVVVVAAGAWTPRLVPDLAPMMRATGHPVYHLAHLAHLAAPEPDAADDPFDPARFPVFTADVARTGWYGFPRHPRSGVLKIANHGVGVALDPARDERVVTDADIERARAFLADALPALANAPIPYTRRCLYCDTLDGHFVIDRHPRRPGLVVASGGSGHGFKFAPLVGDWIADVASGLAPIDRFRWRALDAGTRSQEAARHRGGDDDGNDGGNDGDSDANDDNDGRDEGVP